MASSTRLVVAALFLTWLQVAAEASDQQIVYIRNTCECWNTDLKCVCKIESDPTSVRPLMQRLVNRTAEYYWQEIEFQSMVYDRTTFILANTFADGPFPSGITFKGDFSIVNDSFNHLNMTLNKVELNFETFSGRKPKFSKQYWRYIFDHGEATLRTLRIIKYQIEDFIIPNYLGAALAQEVRPLTEFKVTGCEVKEVKERAFKNFTQLEVVDLSDNHLTTLPENVFSRNINLQKILLANNQISFLTKTIFDGLPNLLLINLRKNKLTAVPAIPRHTNRRFQPMVYLMADNSIHCRCSLIWVLHELTFHHNLEIEATCSDPTMVRGMPIIEGFTRMDKEACYRMVRKEDGTIEREHEYKDKDKDEQQQQLALAGKSDAAQGHNQQMSATDKSLQLQQQHLARPVPTIAETDRQPAAVVTNVAHSGPSNSPSVLASHNVDTPAAALAPVVSAAASQQAQTLAESSVDNNAQQSSASLKHPAPAAAAAATSQLVNVAPQTILAPVQSALPSPVLAAAPAPAMNQEHQVHHNHAPTDSQAAVAPGSQLHPATGSGSGSVAAASSGASSGSGSQ